MKEHTPDHEFMEIPSPSVETTPERRSWISESATSTLSPSSSTDGSPISINSKKENSTSGSVKKKLARKPGLMYRVRDHVKMGPKLSETVKGKLSLGARIIQEGGREKIFKKIFGEGEGEELLKASQCYLSTTDGPIAGLLFTSTHKVGFCSERSIPFHSPAGELIRAPYKVVIPIQNIKRANPSENVNDPAQKYIEIMTKDGYEFWFMGFLRYEKAFKNLQKAISMSA